jgi:hypothetical protein
VFRCAEKLGRPAERSLVELRGADRQWRLRRHPTLLAPDINGALQRRRTRPAGFHRAHGLRDQTRGMLRLADAGRMIDQPGDYAVLVADFVQMAEVLADIRVRDFANQGQNRRVHRIGGEEGGRGVEEAGPARPRKPAAWVLRPPSAI